VFSQCRLDGK
jgi:hypothetical protein